jgi:uncharacterized protein YprB with RNaseH-like and TPR domain
MLRHTFCHLPGVAARTEQRLWAEGVRVWEDLLAGHVPRSARRLSLDELRESVRRHATADAAWFDARLPASQAWRLFHDFRRSCAYLDIETTGMGPAAEITTIALSDGRSVRTYVRGRNLGDFAADVAEYRLLVTYNGKSFDLPMLRHRLNCRFDQGHIDLRHILAGLGLTGGLKAVERRVGLERPGLEDVDGAVAVLLWRDHDWGRNERALETLLAYNVQDAVNLETLMVQAHNAYLQRLSGSFAADYVLPPPTPPANPFRPDPETVERVVWEATSLYRAGGWGGWR